MIFNTYGDKKNPACIFIHGMFANYVSCYNFAKSFADEYYVILPTLDSHYAGSPDITDKYTQAKKILDYLRAEGIEEVKLVHGTSMGAVIAFEFAKITDVKVDNLFFDGGPFFRFNKIVKKVIANGTKKTVKYYRSLSMEELAALDEIKPFIKNDKRELSEIYADYKVIFENYQKKGIPDRIADVCFSFGFDKAEGADRFTFFYSKGEPAVKCVGKLKKKYPSAKFITVETEGHCEYQNSYPEEYVKIIKDSFNGEV
ncbi:MAG: hypothetical protein MJ072_03365 [Clostridia bacterium]|nr:hypothetical protein [Clostridia bacterium]